MFSVAIFERANFHPIVIRQRSQGLFRRNCGNTLNRRCNSGQPTPLQRSARDRRRHEDIGGAQVQPRTVTYVLFLFLNRGAIGTLMPSSNQAACKPGSVSAAAAPEDGHSSRTPVAGRLARPTRTTGPETGLPRARGRRPYLVLLPVGFTVPSPLPATRCALTAPFHPDPQAHAWAPAGGLLSVALSLGSPPPGITRHRVSVEPGLSSPERAPEGASRERPSGRLIRA
jgi:hypothetical protein